MILVNGFQAIYVNPAWFKCISDMKLSPVDKELLTILFIFIALKKYDLIR